MKTKAAEKPPPTPIQPAVTSDEPPSTRMKKRPVGRPPSAALGVTMEDVMRWRMNRRLEQFDAEWHALGMDAKIANAMKTYLALSPDNTREKGLVLLLAEIDRRRKEIAATPR